MNFFLPVWYIKLSNVIVLTVRKCITASQILINHKCRKLTALQFSMHVIFVWLANYSIIQVFMCNNATCGHFYHPKCVANQLHPNNRYEAIELEKNITKGFSFTCPIHWCFRCKGLEDRTQEPLQFAVCRRCPKSYHRKCLPRSYYKTHSLSCFLT
jgi:hypothetical protein